MTKLRITEKQDRVNGDRTYWGGFTFKTMSEGTATHVFAAFDERIAGKLFSNLGV